MKWFVTKYDGILLNPVKRRSAPSTSPRRRERSKGRSLYLFFLREFLLCPFHQRRRSKVVSTLGCISPRILKTVFPTTTTKTELSFFLFHGLSRNDKLSVSFSASRHCFLLYSKFPTTFSITYM